MRYAAVLVTVMACGDNGNVVPAHDAQLVDAARDAPLIDAPDAMSSYLPLAKSGTRLAVRWLETADGVQSLPQDNRFQDTQLATVCLPLGFTGGATRCVPTSTKHTLPPAVTFTDAACTQAVAISLPADRPDYAAVYAAGTVTMIDTLYTVGTTASPLPTQRFDKINGACVEQFGGGGPSMRAYPVTVFTDVVELTTTTMGSGRIQQEWLSSSDGFGVSTTTFVDTLLAEHCSLGAAYCVVGRGTDTFGDAACTQPKLGAPQGSTPPTSTYANHCPALLDGKVFAVGAATTASPLYANRGTCQSSSGQALTTYYAAGAQLGTMESATIALAANPLGRRLVPYVATMGSLAVQTRVFRDTTLGLDCQTGDTQCMPYVWRSELLYTDSACTQSVEVVAYDNVVSTIAACNDTPLPVFARLSPTGTIHAVGAPVINTQLYVKSPSNCDPADQIRPASTVYYRVDGAVLDPASLESVTLVVGP